MAKKRSKGSPLKIAVKDREFNNLLKQIPKIDRKMTRQIRAIFLSEFKKAEKKLKKYTLDQQTDGAGGHDPPGTYLRTGALSETIHSAVTQQKNRLSGELGFFPFLSPKKNAHRLAQQIDTQVNGAEILPDSDNESGLLTFPIHGKTPRKFLRYTGQDNTLDRIIQQASRTYYLVWFETWVAGRKLGSRAGMSKSKADKLIFIFARAPSVYVAPHIPLYDQLTEIQEAIYNRISMLTWNWEETEG